jgi:hypothetical protein
MAKTVKIKPKFEHDGFTFTQLETSKTHALFKKECLGEEGQSIKGYEVICINCLGYYPSDEQFGVSAWYYSNLNLARNHYNKLENK